MNERIWQAKLAAFIHDPATKTLILMRGIGHESGSVAELRKAIFQSDEAKGVLDSLEDTVRKADWWASAADRPQLPMSLKVGVNFASNPGLIHPLTGEYFPIQGFVDESDAKPDVLEALNFNHFQNLVVKKDGGEIDWQKTFLSFWRFGKEYPPPDLGVLWGELPADTRSPDHSIWEHLSLTSAFAGALAEEDGEPALLLVSFGPVQGFIAQARSSINSYNFIKYFCLIYGTAPLSSVNSFSIIYYCFSIIYYFQLSYFTIRCIV
jgi:CRISPR-associated protein Cmr2